MPIAPASVCSGPAGHPRPTPPQGRLPTTLRMGAGDGTLELVEVQPEGKGPQPEAAPATRSGGTGLTRKPAITTPMTNAARNEKTVRVTVSRSPST